MSNARRVEVSRRGQGVTIVATCAEKLAHFAEHFIERFFNEAAAKPNVVSWWGPAAVVLRALGPGRLRFSEPDFRVPDYVSAARDDVSDAIGAAIMTGSICRTLRVKPINFDIRHVLLTYKGTLDMERVYLHRKFASQPIANTTDSGWYLGPDPSATRVTDEELARKENYKTERIWELYYRRPMAVAALALPREYVARIAGDTLFEIADDQSKIVWRYDPSSPLIPD